MSLAHGASSRNRAGLRHLPAGCIWGRACGSILFGYMWPKRSTALCVRGVGSGVVDGGGLVADEGTHVSTMVCVDAHAWLHTPCTM